MTLTVTSSPSCRTSVTLDTRSHDSSEMWINPSAPQAEDDVALFVLGLQHIDLDEVTRLQADRFDLPAQAKLLARDDPFRLGADVNQHLVGVDAHHDSIDDVPVVGGLEGLLVVMEVVLHGHRR